MLDLEEDAEESSATRLELLVLLEDVAGFGGWGEGECLAPLGRGTAITWWNNNHLLCIEA